MFESWDLTRWLGVSAIFVFYLLILAVGIAAAWWKTRKTVDGVEKDVEETALVAGRDIGMVVGIFTMVATWVGGGYINGTAEVVYTSGILHAQAPIGYAISLFVGGIFFAKVMRERRYTTMIDPFQQKYGVYVGSLAYFPALCGELLWSAAVLNALGSSVSVVLEMSMTWSVIVSAFIAVFYTFFGGLYSVAYTDVIQLLCIIFGLLLTIPFAWNSPSVDMSTLGNTLNNATSSPSWLGTIPPSTIGSYIDLFLLLIFGGMPWQVYFQRVLSSKSPRRAQVLSITGGIGCLLLSIPPIIIGLIARATDWDSVDGLSNAYVANHSQTVLPEVIHKLTNPAVMFFGLGAVSAAVMSSSDSSILSASSMFAHNIYKGVIRRSASSAEVVIVLRGTILVVGGLSCLIALTVTSVYDLFYLCSDLVYVLLFPQLVGVIYIPLVNSYGVVGGMLVGLAVRVAMGEAAIGVGPIFDYGGNFPAKTVAMLCSFAAMLLVSWLFDRFVPREWDVLNYFDRSAVWDPRGAGGAEGGEVAKTDGSEMWHLGRGTAAEGGLGQKTPTAPLAHYANDAYKVAPERYVTNMNIS